MKRNNIITVCLITVLLMSCFDDRGKNDGIWYRTSEGAKAIFYVDQHESVLLQKGDTIDLNDWRGHEKNAPPKIAVIDTIIRYQKP